jgi:phenylacetic acid degradation operon negative regulatory protein
MPNRPAAAVRDLLQRFRRQRPLRAGSLLVTIFGDSLMPRGGVIALGSLIPLAAPFGVNERLVRTATARLAQEGWLAARRVGKRSEYRLSELGRERFAEATLRIYGNPAGEGSGRWTLIVLPPGPVAERRRLRQELAWQGFGELANGVFAHPQLPAQALAWPDRALVFEADLASSTEPAALVKLGWDLGDLARRYQRFVTRFGRVEAALGGRIDIDPRTGFIVRTLLIHEYRRLHLRDPLLPARYLPADWPGLEAAALCRSIYARVFTASEDHLSAVGAHLGGALPASDPSTLRRFGGFAVGPLR